MPEDRDYLLALEMQKKWNDELPDNDIFEIPDKTPPKQKPKHQEGKYRSNLDADFLNRTDNLVHPQWETLDPTPDSHALFRAFDDKFFNKKLRCVTLEWSKRMYSCAGICYSRRNGLGMAITIRLSEPLLKLRSRKDLVETMLHEMIHAYCFVLGIREGNGGHGPNFKKIMHGINQVAGTNITVYHTFHDEVNVYKTHWWRCNGSCQHRSPFFGYVKRTSNRAPGPNDFWWGQHLNSCGGTFMKIKEPEKPAKKTKQPKSKAIEANNVKSSQPKAKPNNTDLRKFFPPSGTAPRIAGGAIKSNGGGTLLLNPKTKPVSSTVTSTPPSEPPKPQVRSQGNLKNVVGFKDLGEDGAPRTPKAPPREFSMTGKGYSLATSGSCSDLSQVDREVDRNHLRNVWLKRFGSTPSLTEHAKKSEDPDKDDVSGGNAKRRRLSTPADACNEVAFVADEATPKPDWEVIDDDVMVQEVKNTVIDISSSSDEEEGGGDSGEAPRKAMVFADADARQKQIKKEILDESNDLSDGNDEDIVLIDDEYDDNALSTSLELADTSLVDDLFGEDTLLKEFKNENAVMPSCSRYSKNPQNDIITCPICQEKMKRENFSEHLDGCVGIVVKIEYGKNKKNAKPIRAKSSTPKKKSSSLSSSTSTSRKSSKTTSKSREILLSAGYTEEDLENLPTLSEESTLNESSNTEDDLNLSERHRRSNGLYTQTRPCPACCQEVDIEKINEHLDECLEND
ncbi:DNA-dependent metalloprotease SPRTN-like [Eupeodes corollae]|uniref:DNA-dependent metalloprotease SPRTN-like n=1 Tax=Eupeodes corollae TaxID=290404 RepID=UPI0024928B32|nr:DNA-dependent metalloprotease SPRTN-like [Eupeodes corollae]